MNYQDNTLQGGFALDPNSYQRFLLKGGLVGLGDAYIRGDWWTPSVSNALLEIIKQKQLTKFNFVTLKFLIKHLFTNPQIGSGAFEVAEGHYDLGNDLFREMLDESMSYTCGYWKEASTLAKAQEAKLELACQKLQLQPGMKVLDIGCGWGNFAEYAARKYGASVTGITVSKEQAQLAKERCKDLTVEIVVEDYQKFEGSFDKIVSIEMIEAVGKKNIGAYFDSVSRLLKPKGSFLLQVISAESFNKNSTAELDQFLIWLVKHIFPNGYLPNLSEICKIPNANFTILSLENFAEDYVKTLKAWEVNFEKNWGKLKQSYSEEFRRKWQFYLCGCQAMFSANLVQLYQVLYQKRV